MIDFVAIMGDKKEDYICDIVASDYKPEYAEGQILVMYKHYSVDDGFAEEFGKGLGYDLISDNSIYYGSAFLYETKPGEEDSAIKDFKAHPKFVDWAARRDLKFERRYNAFEEAISVLEYLRDRCNDLPDGAIDLKIKSLFFMLQEKLYRQD